VRVLSLISKGVLGSPRGATVPIVGALRGAPQRVRTAPKQKTLFYADAFLLYFIYDLKSAIYRVVTPFSLVEVFRRFGGICCFRLRVEE
jgi:hypothetical protein